MLGVSITVFPFPTALSSDTELAQRSHLSCFFFLSRSIGAKKKSLRTSCNIATKQPNYQGDHKMAFDFARKFARKDCSTSCLLMGRKGRKGRKKREYSANLRMECWRSFWNQSQEGRSARGFLYHPSSCWGRPSSGSWSTSISTESIFVSGWKLASSFWGQGCFVVENAYFCVQVPPCYPRVCVFFFFFCSGCHCLGFP